MAWARRRTKGRIPPPPSPLGRAEVVTLKISALSLTARGPGLERTPGPGKSGSGHCLELDHLAADVILQDRLSTALDDRSSRDTMLCRAVPSTRLPVWSRAAALERPRQHQPAAVRGKGPASSSLLSLLLSLSFGHGPGCLLTGYVCTTYDETVVAGHPRSMMIDRACFGDRHRCSFLPETTARFVPYSNRAVLGCW